MSHIPRSRRALRAACTSAGSIVLIGLAAFAASIARGQTVAPASYSPEARHEAISALAFDQLSEEAQAKVGAVVTRPTIYRRLPVEAIACDAELYLLLVRNPDIIVNIWQLMEVTNVTMDRTAPYNYASDDKAGTLSQVEMIYGTPQQHIYYATTHYEGPLFARPVNARVVLLLRSEYGRSEDGRPRITSVMDAFIKIDHLAANLVARTLSPVVGKTADHNFVESFRFLARMSETAEANGPGMQQLAMKLERVDPQVRQQLADVAGAVAERAVQRAVAAPAIEPAAEEHAATPTPPEDSGDAAAATPVEEPLATSTLVAPAADGPSEAATLPPRAMRLRR